ncbi:MAG: flagellar basal body rod protein FlgB [Alkaliphilus sp.]|nr:flagellar basal body rod protein FlgB [Alkaliphilus transvaalensis]MBN4069405.1 flagellar basal body rod protein FlgB [bacterium AH-315-G05]PHS35238.1 MAG: flagellar basal body rod protein FlgB [Alkaliphilus sp.]
MFKNIGLLTSAANASWKRNEVIANNIANVNTPNFKKSSLKFEELLQNYLNSSTLAGKTTNERHITIGNKLSDDIKFEIVKHNDYSTRRDGNNVEIDVEMAEMAKNSITYNTIIAKMNADLRRLRTVIVEGGR